MNLFAMNYRKCDAYGCGYFGAPRGDHSHQGVDMACPAGTEVGSPVKGQVTKLGWCYDDDPKYRYVQVVAEGYQYRMFYVFPTVAVGDWVEIGEIIGKSQDLTRRYAEDKDHPEPITNHVHFEIKDKAGRVVDPTPVIVALRGTLRDGGPYESHI